MQCHKRKTKVPEDEYEVTGTNVSPGNMAPRRARLNREKQVTVVNRFCYPFAATALTV